MSRKPRDGSKRAGGAGGGDDVEAILRAAEDELLLNLSIDSHAARGASHSPSSYLDPDLHRRFQSLKSAKPPPLQHRPDKQASRSDDNTCREEDHLFARFSALKGSVTVPPSSSSLEVGNTDDDDDVDKVIRWAIDAARLDPSPESNVDDDTDNEVESNCGSSSGDDDDDDDDDDNDNDDGEDNKRGKELKKNKK